MVTRVDGKSEILLTGTTTPVTSSASSKIGTINMTGYTPRETAKLEEDVLKYLKLLDKDVYANWPKLSEQEKQQYYAKVETLKAQYEQQEKINTSARKQLNNTSLSTETRQEIALTAIATSQDANFKKANVATRNAQLRDIKCDLLEHLHPELGNIKSMPRAEQERIFRTYSEELDVAITAYQKGYINNIEDYVNLTKQQQQDIEFENAQHRHRTRRDTTPKTTNYILKMGNLNKDIAKANNMSLEEYRSSSKRAQMEYDFLLAKGDKLTGLEKIRMDGYKDLINAYGEIPENFNVVDEGSVTNSYIYKLLEGEDVDLTDPKQLENLVKKVQADIMSVPAEELETKLTEILNSTNTIEGRTIVKAAVIKLEREGKIEAQTFYNANKKLGLSNHDMVAASAQLSAEGQVQTANYVAANCTGENPEFSGNQAANYTLNVIPNYKVEVQAQATNTMTDTGLQEVYDVLPDTYAKLDTQAAKDSFEHAMKSENISADQKAIIAKDAIDNAKNDDLKDFFQNIANNFGIDYNSVPPRSERTSTPKETTNNTENNTNNNQQTLSENTDTIDNTNYTRQQFEQYLAQSIRNSEEKANFDFLDTFENLLGLNRIDNIEQAIKQLGNGESFAKVFAKCNDTTKKELAKEIFKSPQKDEAIRVLLENDASNYTMLMACAPNQAIKDKINKTTEHIQWSTLQAEKKQLEKAEQAPNKGLDIKR